MFISLLYAYKFTYILFCLYSAAVVLVFSSCSARLRRYVQPKWFWLRTYVWRHETHYDFIQLHCLKTHPTLIHMKQHLIHMKHPLNVSMYVNLCVWVCVYVHMIYASNSDHHHTDRKESWLKRPYTYIHKYIYVCMYIYICLYIYIYILDRCLLQIATVI